MKSPIARDIDAVQSISGVPAMLELAAAITGMGFACIARVTAHSWTACAVHDRIGFGLEAGYEMEVSQTICNEVRNTNLPVTVARASEDPVYCHHPILREHGFESYISLPVRRRDGSYFGTLCALDHQPRDVDNAATLAQMTLLTHLLSQQLAEAELAEAASEAASEAGLDAGAAAALGEQYQALLGHDLRTPLRAIADGIETVLRATQNMALRRSLEETRRNTFRLSGRVGDMLDFTRAKLAGGIAVTRAVSNTLEADFGQVVAHWQKEFPEREISAALHIEAVVHCDRVRVAQLLSILLANALQHGDAQAPVRVRAGGAKGGLVVSVENRGPALSEASAAALFQPYWRDAGHDKQAGLGLGLYIAAQIARAHGGTLDMSRAGGATVFTFAMPL